VTPEQFTGLIGALTGLLVAVTALAVQVHAWHKQINSRMDQLLEVTRDSARAEGKLEGPSGVGPLSKRTGAP
jgi:hypothetical protein